MATNLHQTATVHPATTPPRLDAEPRYSLRPCLEPFLIGSFLTILSIICTAIVMVFFPAPPLITLNGVEYPTTISTSLWNLSLEVTNRNLLSKIFFDYFDVLLSYDSKPIAQTKHGPFVQARMGQTVLYTNLNVSEHVVRKMVEDQTRGRLVVQIQSLYAINRIKFKKEKELKLYSWHDHFNMG